MRIKHVYRSFHVASSSEIPLPSLTQQRRISFSKVERPTEPLAWWEDGTILGGRDVVGGGTWLGSTRDGRVAFLTNFRELDNLPHPKTRGDLTLRFLQSHPLGLRFSSALHLFCNEFTRDPNVGMMYKRCRRVQDAGEDQDSTHSVTFINHYYAKTTQQSNKSPQEFAEEVLKEAHLYNGFNLILADICNSTMVYVFNRPTQDQLSLTQVTPGIHVLTNGTLDAPWPKAERLHHNFKELIDQYGENEFPIKEMVEKLMTNTTKDEECVLPGIHPPARELPLSSIFVEANFPLGRYGTRSSSALFVKSNKEVNFYEKYLDQENWKERMVTYHINDK